MFPTFFLAAVRVLRINSVMLHRLQSPVGHTCLYFGLVQMAKEDEDEVNIKQSSDPSHFLGLIDSS